MLLDLRGVQSWLNEMVMVNRLITRVEFTGHNVSQKHL